MATFVSIDCEDGTLTRYIASPPRVQATHRAVPNNGPSILTAALVRNFLEQPPDEFALEPPPRPTNPPAGAGTATIPKAA